MPVTNTKYVVAGTRPDKVPVVLPAELMVMFTTGVEYVVVVACTYTLYVREPPPTAMGGVNVQLAAVFEMPNTHGVAAHKQTNNSMKQGRADAASQMMPVWCTFAQCSA